MPVWHHRLLIGKATSLLDGAFAGMLGAARMHKAFFAPLVDVEDFSVVDDSSESRDGRSCIC